MVPTLQRIIVGNILNNTSVSVKHTSQRSNQRHLCKNERRRRTTKFYEQTRFERTPESSTAECEYLGLCAGDRGRFSFLECLRTKSPKIHL